MNTEWDCCESQLSCIPLWYTQQERASTTTVRPKLAMASTQGPQNLKLQPRILGVPEVAGSFCGNDDP